MADPVLTLSSLLQPVFDALADGNEADPTVRPSDHADAQINGALPLAKRIGTNPRELAQRVVDAGALDDVVSAAEVAGPGFINVNFAGPFLADQVAEVAEDERLGVPDADPTKTVVIDYSAPNVAKEMHVGHLRTTVIGDALSRMLEFVGHHVIRENHIGDWGRPFGMLIEHLIDIGEDAAAEGLAQNELDAFYKAANAKFDADEEFAERSRQRVVLLQNGDVDTIALWQRLVDLSTEYFNTVYDKLGILLSDDDLAGESQYQPLMPDTLARLEASELLVDDDGARVVFPPGFTNRDGDPLPLIIQARTGGFNYATSDLACVIDRVERLNADLMLYVVDAGQSQHFQMVFEVARMAGWLDADTEAVHVPFGVVLGPDRRRLRSRSGEPVKLIDLVDEAVDRAEAAMAEKNPDLDPAERSEVARMIGIGALKYAELSSDRVKDYVFDWDRMVSFDGNTGPYLQYAHARICSLFRRAEVDRTSVRTAPIEFGEPEEHALALRLLSYPTAIDTTLETYSPHKLCTYLYELATDFTSFYERCPVLKADEPTRTSRLALCDLTARVLAHGLGLLGIDAPERM
ncbi:MAG: arginine--tRNA ligase [Ilumatobacteraceae bacterium]|nr:arginine--tRNA ligase [Ilumatobacteraceae bacterium]